MKFELNKKSISALFKSSPRHAYGLSVSDSVLELVNLHEKKGKVIIDHFSRVILEPGIIQRGFIKKADDFVIAVNELTKEVRKQGEKLIVVVAFPDYQVYTRLKIFKPGTYDRNTIDAKIASELKKSIPVDPRNLTVRSAKYVHLSGAIDLMIYAAEKTLIQNWLAHFKKCNISLAVIEMESLALIRSLIQECPTEVAFFLLDLGASSTDLCVFDCNGIKLSASIPKAGKFYTETIAKKLQIEPAEAEKLKCSVGLIGPGDQNVIALLREALAPVAKKVNKEIAYFEKSGKKVQKIFLAGGTSAMPGIVEFFRDECKKDVERGHPWIDVKSGMVSSFAIAKKRPPKKKERYYSGATGLALRGLNRGKIKEGINFL